MTRESYFFRRHIALPQDHGSWVFILSPLLIGLFAGGDFTLESVALIISALSAFMMRQPITMATKAYSGRRPRSDLRAAWFWVAIYGVLGLLAFAWLAMRGFGFIIYLAIPGGLIFVWHLFLVSRRSERRQAGVEIIATGTLALAAPAAYWVGLKTYDFQGGILWGLIWLQSAASIVHAYMRLAQRGLKSHPGTSRLFNLGSRALMYTSFNLVLVTFLSISGFLPKFIFIPYLLQWAETIRGIIIPAIGNKPTTIGVRQLIVSSLFTLLFIILWNK